MFIAEPVGSCTDLVATVTYPLRRLYGEDFQVAPVSVLVWRQNSRVHYRSLERPERAALEVASAGARFAAICETIAAACGEDEQLGSITPVELINRLLARWLSEGLLVLADR